MCELPRNIMIENAVMEVDMLGNYFGLLGKDNIFENNASIRETGNGLIFTTGGFTISLIWSKNSVFLFDSHSRDGNGTFTSNGNSIVLSFKSLIDVNCYIKMEYSKHLSNFHEQQYELQYVRVRAKDNTSAISDAIKRNRKRVQNKASFDKIYGTPSHDKIKNQKCENHAKLFGTPEHDKVKKAKRVKYAELIL